MKKFLVACVTATLLALNLQTAPPASASNGCDAYEQAMINAVNSASLMSTITNAAANWRTCLSGYADSRNSYSGYFYSAGGFYYAIMTASATINGAGRKYAMKAVADYRMNLLGEESTLLNVSTGSSLCDSTYKTLIAVYLAIGDIGLASHAQNAYDDCPIIRNFPSAKVKFSYSGTLGVGTTLNAISGSWPVNVSVNYQWFRGQNAIFGETGSQYTVQQGDVGSQLRVRVTGSKAGLTSVSRFSDYTDVIVLPMTLTPTPSVSGVHKVGNTLTASPGTWDSGVTLSYQWIRNGSLISGATSSTYTLTDWDANNRVSVRVTATKPGYQTAVKESVSNSVAGLDITLTPTPTFTGTKSVGSTLTATAGTWDSGVSLSYQWLRDGVEISGATSSTYTVVGEDGDRLISVRVTGTKFGYTTVSKTSLASKVELANFTSPNLTPWLAVFGGDAAVGKTAQAALFLNENGVEFSYVWLRNGTPIPGLTTMSYVFTSDDFDTNISVTVTAKKLGYKTLVGTTNAVKVGGATQTLTPTPTITGTAKVGQTLTAVPGSWGAGIGLTYKWLRGGVPIEGATGISYLTTGDDYLQNISVEVTGSARGFNTVSKVSAVTNIGQGTIVNSFTPQIFQTMRVGSKLVCQANSDIWDAGVNISYTWLRDGAAFGAPQTDNYTLTPSDLGKSISCSVTGTKTGFAPVTKTSTAGTVLAGRFDRNPKFSGDLKAGSVVSIDRSIWPDSATLSIQWYSGGQGLITAIPGATSLTYKLTAAEAGKVIWAKVGLTAPGYETINAATVDGLVTVPAVTIQSLSSSNPAVITGEPRVGSKVTILPGVWDQGTVTTITVAGWDATIVATGTCSGSSNCTWVGSQVDSEGKFLPSINDLGYSLLVTVSGSFEGIAATTSTYMPIAKGVFDVSSLPAITGTLRQGSTVSVSIPSFGPGATIQYQWGRELLLPSGDKVFSGFAGETGATHQIWYMPFSYKLSLRLTISAPGFETKTHFYPYLDVKLPTLTLTPKPFIFGDPKVGTTLYLTVGSWDEQTFASINWYRDGVLIPGKTSKTYLIGLADFGKKLSVKVTGTRTGYEPATVSSDELLIGLGTMSAANPSMTGRAQVGSTLTAKVSAWAPGAKLSYQWLLDGKAIKGATSRTYKLLAAQKGKRISLTVTQRANGYTTVSKTSASIKVG